MPRGSGPVSADRRILRAARWRDEGVTREKCHLIKMSSDNLGGERGENQSHSFRFAREKALLLLSSTPAHICESDLRAGCGSQSPPNSLIS